MLILVVVLKVVILVLPVALEILVLLSHRFMILVTAPFFYETTERKPSNTIRYMDGNVCNYIGVCLYICIYIVYIYVYTYIPVISAWGGRSGVRA